MEACQFHKNSCFLIKVLHSDEGFFQSYENLCTSQNCTFVIEMHLCTWDTYFSYGYMRAAMPYKNRDRILHDFLTLFIWRFYTLSINSILQHIWLISEFTKFPKELLVRRQQIKNKIKTNNKRTLRQLRIPVIKICLCKVTFPLLFYKKKASIISLVTWIFWLFFLWLYSEKRSDLVIVLWQFVLIVRLHFFKPKKQEIKEITVMLREWLFYYFCLLSFGFQLERSD